MTGVDVTKADVWEKIIKRKQGDLVNFAQADGPDKVEIDQVQSVVLEGDIKLEYVKDKVRGDVFFGIRMSVTVRSLENNLYSPGVSGYGVRHPTNIEESQNAEDVLKSIALDALRISTYIHEIVKVQDMFMTKKKNALIALFQQDGPTSMSVDTVEGDATVRVERITRNNSPWLEWNIVYRSLSDGSVPDPRTFLGSMPIPSHMSLTTVPRYIVADFLQIAGFLVRDRRMCRVDSVGEKKSDSVEIKTTSETVNAHAGTKPTSMVEPRVVSKLTMTAMDDVLKTSSKDNDPET